MNLAISGSEGCGRFGSAARIQGCENDEARLVAFGTDEHRFSQHDTLEAQFRFEYAIHQLQPVQIKQWGCGSLRALRIGGDSKGTWISAFDRAIVRSAIEHLMFRRCGKVFEESGRVLFGQKKIVFPSPID